MTKRNTMSNTALTLHGGGHPYHIHRERIDTPGKVLHWLAHLSDKDWFTITDARAVMTYASSYCDVDPYTENI